MAAEHGPVKVARILSRPSVWLPASSYHRLACGAMEPADALDVQNFLIWKTLKNKDGSESRKLHGVKDFHIAKALLEGHKALDMMQKRTCRAKPFLKESLGVLVESSGRQMSIFDVCLQLGHTDTALALARHGIQGCTVQPSHMGYYAEGERRRKLKDQCRCISQTQRCDFCTFGWDRGIWMKDWDAPFWQAANAANQAVQQNPIVHDIMLCPDMIIEECFSREAMARVLDIAILTGKHEAALRLSRRCQVRPLRRWCVDDLFAFDGPDIGIAVVIAALAAGADLHRMQVMPQCNLFPGHLAGTEKLPFQTAVLLSDLRDPDLWYECVRLCPPLSDKSKLRRVQCPNSLGFKLLAVNDDKQTWGLSKDKVRVASKTDLDMRDFRFKTDFDFAQLCPSTLLGMAILCGQPDCAIECLRLGVDITGWEEREDLNDELKSRLQDETNSMWEFLFDRRKIESPAFTCRSAARAAGVAALQASLKRQTAEKGVLIIQLFKKTLGPKKSFPVAIVNDILSFSTEVPKFVAQLGLWDLVNGWVTSAAGIRDKPEVRKESGRSRDPQTSSDQPSAASGAAVAHDGSADAEMEDAEVDDETTHKMLTAVRESRADVPALNADGVYLFRLTRMATSSHVSDLLLDSSGPLADLHARVLAADCKVNPEWSPVKALFVPVTEMQMAELYALSGQGYELNKTDHILALQDDHATIEEALKSHLRWKNRPRLKKVGPQYPETDMEQPDDGPEEADMGPLLIMEGGPRTDSDLGFGGYQL